MDTIFRNARDPFDVVRVGKAMGARGAALDAAEYDAKVTATGEISHIEKAPAQTTVDA